MLVLVGLRLALLLSTREVMMSKMRMMMMLKVMILVLQWLTVQLESTGPSSLHAESVVSSSP